MIVISKIIYSDDGFSAKLDSGLAPPGRKGPGHRCIGSLARGGRFKGHDAGGQAQIETRGRNTLGVAAVLPSGIPVGTGTIGVTCGGDAVDRY